MTLADSGPPTPFVGSVALERLNARKADGKTIRLALLAALVFHGLVILLPLPQRAAPPVPPPIPEGPQIVPVDLEPPELPEPPQLIVTTTAPPWDFEVEREGIVSSTILRPLALAAGVLTGESTTVLKPTAPPAEAQEPPAAETESTSP